MDVSYPTIASLQRSLGSDLPQSLQEMTRVHSTLRQSGSEMKHSLTGLDSRLLYQKSSLKKRPQTRERRILFYLEILLGPSSALAGLAVHQNLHNLHALMKQNFAEVTERER